MKFLVFSDLHLDAAFAWAGGSARRRREALRQTLLRIVTLAVNERVDAILCGGDLYEHERISPDTREFLRSTFERVHPLPVYIAPGNHDWFGRESVYSQVYWSPNVHVFKSDRLEPLTMSDGVTLWGAAHRAPVNTGGFLDGFRVDRSGLHIALFHGSELAWVSAQEEGKAPHAPFAAEQIVESGFHHVFLGHYHRPRDADRHTYPGNPEPLSLGEDGERGVVLATVAPDGSLERRRCRVAVTEFHDLRVDLTGCATREAVRERVSERLAGLQGVAGVTLTGELAREVDLHRRDLDGIAPHLEVPALVRYENLRVAYDVEGIAEEATVRGEFVRLVQQAGLPEEKRRRVLLTGVRALDGRDDLEVL